MYAGLIIGAFAPIRECEIAARLRCFFRLPKPLKEFNTLRDEVLRRLLTTRGLIGATLESSQGSHSQQYFSLGLIVKTVEPWRAVPIRPKLVQRFARCFVFANLFKLFGRAAGKFGPLGKCEIGALDFKGRD
jgi:hypothetical protein